MTSRHAPLLIASIGFVLVACPPVREPVEDPGCTAGQSVACTCTSGRSGAQICNENGSFGACTCDGDGDAGLVRDGGAEADGGAEVDAGGVDAGGVDAGGVDAGGVDAGSADAGTVHTGTPCEVMCAHVYEDCGRAFSTGNTQLSQERCVAICDEGTFSRAQRTCFTAAVCEADAVNACFDVRPVCPRDADCSERQCGVEPECQTVCGTCDDASMCGSDFQCAPAHGWVHEVANAGRGESQAFAIDEAGVAHAAFLDPTGKVYFGTRAGNWSYEEVERIGVQAFTVGQFVALRLAPGGLVHLAYRDGTTGALRYARREAGSWTFEKVQDAAGEYVAMVLDASGRPHLAYAAGTEGHLTYAWREGAGSWHVEEVDAGYGSGYFAVVAVASDGTPHVASNLGYQKVQHARREGSAWVKTVVQEGLTPAFVQLVLDAQGVPHLAWHANGANEIRAAHGGPSGFTVETVAVAGNANAWTSLVVGADGTLHLAFMQSGSNDLVYAKRGSTSWATTVVDAEGVAGLNCALALTPGGEPWILHNTTRAGALTMLARHLP